MDFFGPSRSPAKLKRKRFFSAKINCLLLPERLFYPCGENINSAALLLFVCKKQTHSPDITKNEQKDFSLLIVFFHMVRYLKHNK
jgi:hypothetical protein